MIDVVTAVAESETAIQTMVAVRDKVSFSTMRAACCTR
jgi:flagellar hook-basal body complex protein FliE